MIKIFEDYALFYDAIYSEKDYHSECDYLESLLETYGSSPSRRLIDLGCGTGNHALILSKRNYEVLGVDMSENMLDQARIKVANERFDTQFLCDDIRHFKYDGVFDVAISMFAVMGYLTSNEDIINALYNINNHLRPGGIFIFDLWFGPAVLKQRPGETKISAVKNGQQFVRYAHPILNMTNQTVQVDLSIETAGQNQTVLEAHLIRFFFIQEIQLLAKIAGMNLVAIHPFLSINGIPSEETWNIACVFQAPLK